MAQSKRNFEGCTALAEDWLDSPEAEDALGLMVFESGPLAHLYQELGEGPAKKAEAEQAFILRIRLKCVRDHGKNWYTEYVEGISRIVGRVKEQRRAAWKQYRADVEAHKTNATLPVPKAPDFADPDQQKASV